MDRLNALRGTPSPSENVPSPTTSQKDAAEANAFFAALDVLAPAGGATQSCGFGCLPLGRRLLQRRGVARELAALQKEGILPQKN